MTRRGRIQCAAEGAFAAALALWGVALLIYGDRLLDALARIVTP